MFVRHYAKFLYGLLLPLLFIFLFSARPHTAEAACYDYNINYGFPPPTYNTKVGVKTISLAYQSPPTMLQTMYFVPPNINAPCVPLFLQNEAVSESFVVNGSTVPAYGFYLDYYNPSPAFTPLNTFWVNAFSDMYSLSSEDGMIKEDAIIDRIDTNKTITARVGYDGVNPYRIDVTAPATNCVKISGNGPRRVVFMRGDSWESDVADFLYQATEVIDKGFKQIDPFKTYINQFSFYADLKKFDDSGYTPQNSIDSLAADQSWAENLKTSSSCYPAIGKSNQYIFYNKLPLIPEAFAIVNADVSVISLTSSSMSLPVVTIHEFAHSFGGLLDEYTSVIRGNLWNLIVLTLGLPTANCTSNPTWNYRYPETPGGKVFGSVTTRGCTYLISPDRPAVTYYRPSEDSIMRNVIANTPAQNKFNVVSCGYLIAAIKGEPTDKAHAGVYWQECTTLDTIGGVPPTLPAPSGVYLNKSSAQIGSDLIATGSGFVPSGNVVRLSPRQDFALAAVAATRLPQQLAQAAQEYYIASTTYDGASHLTFTIQDEVPPGAYNLSLAASINGAWSTTIPFMVLSTTSPQSLTLKSINWNNLGDVTPDRYSNPRVNFGLVDAIPSHDNTTATKWCKSMPGKNYTSGVSTVAIANPQDGFRYKWDGSTWTEINRGDYPRYYTCGGQPQIPLSVTFSTNPSTIEPGQSSTLTWLSTGATSCNASGAWSGSKPLSGSESTGTLTDSKTYTLACTAARDRKIKNAIVTVSPATASSSPATPPTTPPPSSTLQSINWENFGDTTPDRYNNPRVNFGLVDAIPFHDDNTATKWCQSMPGKNYTTGVSAISGENPQDGFRYKWDGSTWTEINGGDYPRYYACGGQSSFTRSSFAATASSLNVLQDFFQKLFDTIVKNTGL